MNISFNRLHPVEVHGAIFNQTTSGETHAYLKPGGRFVLKSPDGSKLVLHATPAEVFAFQQTIVLPASCQLDLRGATLTMKAGGT